MTDRIHVTRIAVFAHHGLHAEETKLGQRFYISLTAEADLAPAGRSDDVAETVSYVDLVDIAVRCATQRTFRLIEGLAEAIADGILAAVPRVDRIVVKVEKPSAPVPAVLETVAVEIERSRHG